MGDMKIVELTGAALVRFLDATRQLDGINFTATLLVAIDDVDGALKMKANNGTWSPPMGRVVE